MVWAFHVKASKPNRPNQVCQECLIEARLRGKKRLTTTPRLPCEMHGKPELWEENEEAWMIYDLIITNQQVLVFNQYDAKGKPKPPIIALNFAAVIPTLRLYILPQRQQECFDKLLLIHEIMASKGVFDFFTKRGI